MSSSNNSVNKKEETAAAGAPAVASSSSSSSSEGSPPPVAKKPKLLLQGSSQQQKQKQEQLQLTDLPPESLSSIMEHLGGDFPALLGLANSNRSLQSILQQQWKCSKCKEGIFVAGPPTSKKNGTAKKEGKNDKGGGDDDDDRTKPEASQGALLVLSIPDRASPFVCGVCGAKLCGQDGHDKRFCSSRKCSGCGKLECHRCVCAHLEDCGACARFPNQYCRECQGPRDNDKTCDLCGFTVCQHHGDRCSECGIQTCGVHDFSCTRCDYCQESYCPRCHTHGDSMWHCHHCAKHSCNAAGDGAGGCPEFAFSIGGCELDWPLCPDCKQDVYGYCESDDDSDTDVEDDENEEEGSADENEEGSDDGENETDGGVSESKQEE